MSTGNDRPDVSAVGLSIQDGAAGMGLTVDTSIQPIWGEITGNDPVLNRPDFYQWKEVHYDFQQTTGKPGWNADSEISDSMGYGSSVDVQDARVDTLMNPAVSVGERSIPIGSIVRLYPTNVTTDPNGFTQRFWLFMLDELRAFRLVKDLIPTGGGELDLTIDGEWLDDLGPTVTLYPNHIRGWPAGDQFFSLGIGRYGTKGWATYVPKATIISVDAEGKPIWRAEWQIVTLDAKMVAQVTPIDDVIDPLEVGDADLYLIANDRGPFLSGYKIKLLNGLSVPLQFGDNIMAYFNRAEYVWETIQPLLGHGLTVRAYNTVILRANGDIEPVPFDQVVARHGILLTLDGNGIRNIGERPLLGRVSWNMTAQRIIPNTNDDVSALVECSLYNGGQLVRGSKSRITSSRRSAPTATGFGYLAVNSTAGSMIQLLQPGSRLEIRLQNFFADKDVDEWTTIQDMSHLTFDTIPGQFLAEEDAGGPG